jgi:hypothetical protein
MTVETTLSPALRKALCHLYGGGSPAWLARSALGGLYRRGLVAWATDGHYELELTPAGRVLAARIAGDEDEAREHGR